MNISGGSVRGFKLKIPTGRSLRPSQNQVRLALFSMLESNYLSETGYQNVRVADLFAGTGALGIEALSRGVQHVDFVEKDKAHIQILTENVHKTGFETKSSILSTNANTFVHREFPILYDLVFIDPPYKLFDTLKLSEIVAILKPTGTLVYLHDAHDTPQPNIIDSRGLNWKRSEIRAYGTTGVSFYTQ